MPFNKIKKKNDKPEKKINFFYIKNMNMLYFIIKCKH